MIAEKLPNEEKLLRGVLRLNSKILGLVLGIVIGLLRDHLLLVEHLHAVVSNFFILQIELGLLNSGLCVPDFFRP